MIISIDNLDFSYGTNTIFKQAKFRLDEGEKIGIVGPNGSGKSTFFKLLVDILYPDSGDISIDKNFTFGYLEQNVNFDYDTVRDFFEDIFSDVTNKEERLRELETLIEKSSGEDQEKYLEEYETIQNDLYSSDAYSANSLVRGMIKNLGFTDNDLDKSYRSLSGGEKTRLNLAKILLRKPDVLLLDEPTNYLDLEMLRWLENTLKKYNGSIILISHDRYFLDSVVDRIVELEDHKLNSYNGNYSKYINKKSKERALKDKEYAKAQKEIHRQKEIIRRYRDINSIQSSKHAKSREIALSKMTEPDKVSHQKDVNLFFKPHIRSGNEVLKVTDLSKSFDERNLFSDVNFQINYQDKVGIIGKNGIGKSTLFNILRKKESKDTGLIELGSKVKPGYFDQESFNLDLYSDYNLIEVIQEDNPEMDDGDIRNFLANFLFTGEDVFKQIKDLSGGEKARIKLAKLILSNSNFLLLDEPTNHIDMPTREVLEETLDKYEGTLLTISHDRYFLNRIANRIFELTEDGLKQYLGNYNDYLVQKRNQESEVVQESAPVTTKTERIKQRRKEKEQKKYLESLKREIGKIEEQIENIDLEIQDYEEQIANPDFYSKDNSLEILENYNKTKEKLDELNNLWEEKSIELEELEN